MGNRCAHIMWTCIFALLAGLRVPHVRAASRKLASSQTGGFDVARPKSLTLTPTPNATTLAMAGIVRLEGAECVDLVLDCENWKLRYCDGTWTAGNQSISDYWCRSSCGTCQGACVDVATDCADWKAGGYCAPQWTYHNISVSQYWCRLTCQADNCRGTPIGLPPLPSSPTSPSGTPIAQSPPPYSPTLPLGTPPLRPPAPSSPSANGAPSPALSRSPSPWPRYQPLPPAAVPSMIPTYGQTPQPIILASPPKGVYPMPSQSSGGGGFGYGYQGAYYGYYYGYLGYAYGYYEDSVMQLERDIFRD